jgi:WD40 repeat protein
MLLQRFTDHTEGIRSVAFLPEHKHVITGSIDHTLKVFSTTTGNCEQTLQGQHNREINCVCVSSSGDFMMSCCDEGLCVKWNVRKGFEVEYTCKPHGQQLVYCLRISQDELKGVSCGYDGSIVVFSFLTGERLAGLDGHRRVVMSLAVDFDFKTCMSASWDASVKVWNLNTYSCETNFFLGQECNAVAISPDGVIGAAGCDGNFVAVWNLRTRQWLMEIREFDDIVVSVAIKVSADHSWILAAGSWDKKARVFCNSDKSSYVLEHDRKVSSVALSKSGSFICTGSFDKSSNLFDLFHDDRMRILALYWHKSLPNDLLRRVRNFLFW